MAGPVQSVIERHWTGDYKELVDDNRDQALCLDSPGGSFSKQSRSVQSESVQVLDRKTVQMQNWFDELVDFDEMRILSGPPKTCFIGVTVEDGYYFPFCLYDENTGLQVGNCESGEQFYSDYFPGGMPCRRTCHCVR